MGQANATSGPIGRKGTIARADSAEGRDLLASGPSQSAALLLG